MSEDIKQLKSTADEARALYNMNLITREQCREKVQPYIDAVNKKSVELAKKYNVRPKFVNFMSYIR